MNEVLRDWYVGDCHAGVTRWNKILERHGFADRLRLPDRKFNRGIGMYSSVPLRSAGAPAVRRGVGRAASTSGCRRRKDREYLLSIMATPVYEPGKFANYIAPPQRGVKRQPINFEYVRTEL